jgi:hypothetical protein
MNRSEGAVKSLYHRTLQQLREVLDDEERNATAMSPENTTTAARRMISQP